MNTMQRLALDRAHPQTESAGQGAIAQNKWQLLNLVEEIRQPLDLKATSIAILRALLSFIRQDQISAKNDAAHICFASNAALARRAHVSVQTVERHVSKLVHMGLLSRRSSGNGKRWARRDAQGQVVLATGLSLLPLVERREEFQTIARVFAQKMQDLTLLRDKCAMALAKLTQTGDATPYQEELKSRARRLFKRKPDAQALADLLGDISRELSRTKPVNPEELRASPPHNEGHKDPDLNPLVKDQKILSIKVSPADMQRSYPRLCAELRSARSQEDCTRKMQEIADHLHLGSLWYKIQALGPALAFMLLGYLLERVETITSPKAYASTLYNRFSADSSDRNSLLSPLHPSSTRKSRKTSATYC